MIDDSKTRYYTIRANRTGDILALVRAATKAAALAHYVADSLAANLSTQVELLVLGADPALRRMDATAYRRTEAEQAAARG